MKYKKRIADEILISRLNAKGAVLVEGAKTDLRLMEHLFHVYGIDEKHQVVSYNTSIYTLYNKM